MAYIIEIAAAALPDEDSQAWRAFDALRASQDEDMDAGKHPLLVRLHDVLTAVYPCLSRYRDDGPALDDCPWSDGPLLDDVGSQVASFGLSGGPNLESVARYVVQAAAMLGLSALDPQTGQIRRPDPEEPGAKYFVTASGVPAGRSKDRIAARLAQAFGRDPGQVRRMLDMPRAIVRTGLDRIAALQYRQMLSKLGCNSGMGPEIAGLPLFMEGGNRPADLQRLRAAAEQGKTEAQWVLGVFHLRGIDLPQDSVQAARWFDLAAQQGDPFAQKMLALCYQKGDGVPMSYAWALEWMRKAAGQGEVDAQLDVAWRYLRGEGVNPDRHEAVRWLRRAAQQNNLAAQSRLGRLLRGSDMPHDAQEEAAFWLQKAADRGDGEAQAAYGDMLWDAEGGLPRDRAQAFAWFQRAAQQDVGAAMARVSACYAAGQGVEQDAVQALRWCRKAAEAGDDWGQGQLGRYYESGELLPEDKRQAYMWYELAARQDNTSAQVRLAVLCLEGVGGEGVDGRRQAEYWLGKAAAAGDEQACDFLRKLRR